MKNPLLVVDLGNVILRHDNALLTSRIAAASSNPECAAIVERVFLRSGVDAGRGTVREWYEQARVGLGLDLTYEAFAAIWCCHFSHDTEMEQLVTELARKYRTVILSNTDDAHWAHILRDYPVMGRMHALYTSFALGMRKPDPAIYSHVLDAENYAAADTIFIDDKIENVDAARTLGIHGIHFTGRAALIADLATLGVTTKN